MLSVLVGTQEVLVIVIITAVVVFIATRRMRKK
jgi:hypothetical protein